MKNILILAVLIWVAKPCFTIDEMVEFINSLPKDKAASSKIFVINSQRSFLGVASSPYYVVYEK